MREKDMKHIKFNYNAIDDRFILYQNNIDTALERKKVNKLRA